MRRRLSEFQREDHYVDGNFYAVLRDDEVDGVEVFVKAVLERTAVIIRTEGEPPELVRKDRLWATPQDVRFIPDPWKLRFKQETAAERDLALGYA